MSTRYIKRRLIKAKMNLSQTLQKILEINRKRKRIRYSRNPVQKSEALNEELFVLNKIASQQAKIIDRYQQKLNNGMMK